MKIVEISNSNELKVFDFLYAMAFLLKSSENVLPKKTLALWDIYSLDEVSL